MRDKKYQKDIKIRKQTDNAIAKKKATTRQHYINQKIDKD